MNNDEPSRASEKPIQSNELLRVDDGERRRRYAASIIAAVVIVLVVVLFLAIGNGITVEDFVLKVIAPLSPCMLLGMRQFTEHIEAATRLEKLKDHAEKLWNEALSGKESPMHLTTASRGLQDEILEGRKRNPLVFDAIFTRLSREYEVQMNHGAAELVADAKRKQRIN